MTCLFSFFLLPLAKNVLLYLTVMLEAVDEKMADIAKNRPPTRAPPGNRALGSGSAQPARFLVELLASCGIEQGHAQPMVQLIDKCAAILTDKGTVA